MKIVSGEVLLSATDLANHLACRHLTELDLASVQGRIEPPPFQRPLTEILEKRGLLHEQRHLEELGRQGFRIVRIEGDDPERATLEAMRAGHDVIAQAALAHGRWRGYADVLLRVPHSSALGEWSYEVVDTKLARQTRAGTILQLCVYSESVAAIQSLLPAAFHVVTPVGQESYRTLDFVAYFRRVRGQLERAADRSGSSHYPEPVEQCQVCRWWQHCDRRRHADDHLSLVAGVSRSQRRELADRGITTLERLAAEPLPLAWKPKRGSAAALERAREQARVQKVGREAGEPTYELLQVEQGTGLARLPEPSPGDVFFDIEGDAFVGTQGLEYLFGYVLIDRGGQPQYRGDWALDARAEKRMFEDFMDFLGRRIERYPDLHVYHFAPYEPGALKRLMGKHATRAEALDELLRAERFVDLHAVVRQGLRASVEQYSIKDLEPFFGYERDVDLRAATEALRAVEWPLELDAPEDISAEARAQVEGYNRDDCIATLRLRDWLEWLRLSRIAQGATIDRPVVADKEASEELGAWLERIRALAARLTAGLPEDPEDFDVAERARWILSHLLEYHRREDKAVWWDYFRLRDLPQEELLDDKAGLYGLEYVGEVAGGTAICPIHRYRFPRQEYDLRRHSELHVGEAEVGTLLEIDHAGRTIDVKKRQTHRAIHPPAVFAFRRVAARPIEGALERLAQWVAEHGVDAPGEHRAARDLLLRRPPRLASPAPGSLREAGEDALGAAKRLALELDEGLLAAQGPPGSGKTYTGARVILELVGAGRTVGVTAVSHKVIRNLLDKTVEAADEAGYRLSVAQKIRSDAEPEPGPVEELTTNKQVSESLDQGTQVVGGTAWLWSRPELHEAVDVLVVDEAGQMSLAMVLAAAQGAKNLILLGDPQQLEQPQQASHPDGTECSALEHLLSGATTMPDQLGLFLEKTYRLHPKICEYTSETFYLGRLEPTAGLERQVLSGCGAFDGAGVFYRPVEHSGNNNSSTEEVEEVKALLEQLTRGHWTDKKGETRPLTMDDVLIVAPYNAQVNSIAETIGGARVGTVDKFQGQEAPVVIYSMASSTPEDAPRGMEFLYNKSRLNVATSRAQCACILVASPALFDPECRTPAQMRLANALCAYLERCPDD